MAVVLVRMLRGDVGLTVDPMFGEYQDTRPQQLGRICTAVEEAVQDTVIITCTILIRSDPAIVLFD